VGNEALPDVRPGAAQVVEHDPVQMLAIGEPAFYQTLVI